MDVRVGPLKLTFVTQTPEGTAQLHEGLDELVIPKVRAAFPDMTETTSRSVMNTRTDSGDVFGQAGRVYWEFVYQIQPFEASSPSPQRALQALAVELRDMVAGILGNAGVTDSYLKEIDADFSAMPRPKPAPPTAVTKPAPLPPERRRPLPYVAPPPKTANKALLGVLGGLAVATAVVFFTR